MKLSRIKIIWTLCLMLGTTIPLSAQSIDFCSLYGDAGGVISDCYSNANGFGFTLNACRPLRYEFDANNLTLTVDGQTFSLTDFNAAYNFDAYITEICGYSNYSSGVPLGTPADPIMGQTLQAFQSRLNNKRATPRGIKNKSEDNQAVTFQQVGANLGVGSFDFNGVEGTSSAALLGYNHYWESGFTLAGNFYYNKLSIDQQKDMTNNTLGLTLEKGFNLMGFKALAGVGYSHLFLADNFSDSDGRAVNLFVTGSQEYDSGSVLNLGLMHQVTEAGNTDNTVTGLSALYGMPLGARGALNVEAAIFENSQDVNGVNLNLDSSFYSSSIIYDNYLGDFVINVGAKKVLGLDGYSNIDYVFSGNIRY